MLTVGRINVIKMSILHIVIYKVYVICFKISKAFFTEIEKKKLKIWARWQIPVNSWEWREAS